MSVIEYDVIVIGAGVAGLTAAIVLSKSGMKVAVVTMGEPTACLSTGCIDLCLTDKNPLSALGDLPGDHPFHRISPDLICRALNDFKDIMEEMGMPYTGDPTKNRRVLSAIGTFKTTCLAPFTMASASQNDQEKLHIVTFAGLKDFYPGYIVSRLKNASFSTYDAGVSTTMGLAANFEDEAFLDTFIAWLENAVTEEDKVAIPAVLGLESAAAVVRKIEYRLERPVFEIPTIPPSMPGRRLFNALKDYFRRRDGVIYWGWPVVGAETSGKQVEAVMAESQGRPNSLNARAFILATGSFVGGGLQAGRGDIIEKVLGLPVFVPGKWEEWFDPTFFSTRHAIGKSGIEVDASFRPAKGPWENVFVCGAIIAQVEALKNGCGNGFALASGHAAALSCLEYLR